MSASRGSRATRGGSGRGRGRYEANSKGSRARNEGERLNNKATMPLTSAPSPQGKDLPKPNDAQSKRSIDRSTRRRSPPGQMLAATTSRDQAWRDAATEDATAYRKRMGYLLETLRESRIQERKNAIRNGFLADPDKPTSLAHAITPVGTCQDMCPEFERVERINQRFVDNCEKTTLRSTGVRVPCEEYMVKRFRRSAAGYDEQLPSDIRPPQVLQKTLNYLINDVIGGSTSLGTVHKFVWDRTRGIRNDFSIQQVTKVEELRIAIDCFERIARFHILSLHQLSRPGKDDGEFDHHQEREQLNNTLLSLMYYYDDSRHKLTSPNEAEFRAYCVISEIQDQRPDLEDRAQTWPRIILKDRKVQTALKLYAAAGNTSDEQGPLRPRASFSTAQANYGLFWSIIVSNEVSYMMACVAETYFNLVRATALESIWRASNRRIGMSKIEEWPLSDLVNALAFDSEDQAQSFGEDHGFSIGERGDEEAYIDLTSVSGRHLTDSNPRRKQMFSNILVEAKRLGRTLPAIINGFSAAEAQARGLLEDSTDASNQSSREVSESLFLSDNSADEVPRAKNFDDKLKITTNGKVSSSDCTVKAFESDSIFNTPNPLPSEPAPSQTSTEAPSPFVFNLFNTNTKDSTFGKPSFPTTNSAVPPKFDFTTPKITTTGTFGTGTKYAFDFTNGLGTSKPENQSNPAVDPFSATRGITLPVLPPSSPPIPPKSTFSFSTLGSATKLSPKPTPDNTLQGTTSIGNTTPKTTSAPPTDSAQRSKTIPPPVFSFPSTTTPSSTSFAPKEKPHHVTPSFALNLPKDQSTVPPTLPPPSSIITTPAPLVHQIPKPIISFPPSTIVSGPNLSPTNKPTVQPTPLSNASFLPSTQQHPSKTSWITPSITELDIFQHKSDEALTTPGLNAGLNRVDTIPKIPLNGLPNPRLSSSSSPSRQATSGPTKQAPLSAALDAIVDAMVLDDEGLLQQFIDYTLGPLVTFAFKEDKDERSWERARENRRTLLGKKYFRRWKSKAWDLCLLRKGKERRRNFARSMRQLTRSTKQQSCSSAHQASSLDSSSDNPTIFQQRQKANTLMAPPPKPSSKRETLIKQVKSSSDKQLVPTPNPSQGVPARRHKSHHKHSNTVDISSVSGRPSLSTNLSNLSRLDGPTLSDGSYISETVMKNARRLASGRTDTTRTDYFRLKAMGIDPDTSIIPKTTTKKRTRDSDGSSPNKQPRPSSSGPATATPLRSNTSQQDPPRNLEHSVSKSLNRNANPPIANVSDDETEALLAQMRTVRNALSKSISWFQSERTKSELGSSHSSVGGTEIRPETEKERKLREWKRTPTRMEQRLRASGGEGVLGDVWRRKREQAKRDEREGRSGEGAAGGNIRVDSGQLRGFAALANRFAEGGGGAGGTGSKVAEQDDDVIELSD